VDPTETHAVVAGLASEARKRLLMVAREYMERTVSGRDIALRLRARLRDLRLEWSSNNS
jgi:hypothetical protein